MSDFEKQLKKATANMKLSAAEKREVRARVVSYMEYHPRRETVAAEKAAAYLESQPYTVLSFDNVYIRSFFGAFAILLFIFVPTIAERAVPGDVLYPVKVRINEEIRSTLTFSASEKVAWETERLERRIAEVRLLASEGKLTDEVEAAAVAAVKEHAEAAQEGIDKLKDTDAEEASLVEVEFESALAVQSAVLDADQPEEETAENADGLALVVREAQATVEATKSTTTPSYEKISARLELQTTRAYELFQSLRDNNIVSPDEQLEIERRLEDIERAIAANAVVTSQEFEDATDEEVDTEEEIEAEIGTEEHVNALLMVLADIKKLISFMTDIDVRGSVALEELVPVVLTPEERLKVVDDTVFAAEGVLSDAGAVLADPEVEWEEGVDEKVQLTIEMLEAALVFTVSTTTQDGQATTTDFTLEEKELQLDTIIGLVESLQSLIAPLQDQVATIIEAEVGTSTPEIATTTEDVVIEENDQATTTESISEEVIQEVSDELVSEADQTTEGEFAEVSTEIGQTEEAIIDDSSTPDTTQ